MTSWMQPQEEREQKLRKTTFITLVGPRDRRLAVQGHMGKPQGSGDEEQGKVKVRAFFIGVSMGKACRTGRVVWDC